MMTKDTYGMTVVMFFEAVLLVMLVCSFVVSFRELDLLYIISVIIFGIKFFRLK